MSKCSVSPERHFRLDGYEFDLQEMAEGMTRDNWPSGAKNVISQGEDGTVRSLSPKEALINSIFGGIAYDEGSMKLRLALIRYFLKTDRELLPEMVELLVAGLDEHIKDGKPWGRPNKKQPTDPELLLCVLAISKKFRGKRPEIAAEQNISADGVSDQIKRARALDIPALLNLFEANMPDRFSDAIELLKPDVRNKFIRKYGVIVK